MGHSIRTSVAHKISFVIAVGTYKQNQISSSKNDRVITLVRVSDTYYLGGGEVEEHIIRKWLYNLQLKLRFTKIHKFGQ